MPLRFALAAFFLPILALAARADLTFDETTLRLKAPPGLDVLRGSFRFRNAGDRPVTIVAVTPSCGCTTATLARKRYGPGEIGMIDAAFSVGERTGPQAKDLIVQTDEANGRVYQLRIETDIPAVITLEPRLLVWQKNAPADPQTVRISYASGASYRLTSAVDASRRFTAEVVPVPDRAEPELRIRPVRTDQAVLGVILVQFAADGASLQRSVLMRVVGAP